jgi:hypothetical protein
VFQKGKEEKRKHSAERAKKKMKKVLDKLPKVWYNEYVPKRNKEN